MTDWVSKRMRDENGYISPGVVRCKCGENVALVCDGVECMRCGQEYNLFGQRLMKDWTSEADDYRNEG